MPQVDPANSGTRRRVSRRPEAAHDEAVLVRRLGSPATVLRLALSPDELRSRALDHRAGYLVSCVDGESSIEVLLDLTPMRRGDALKILVDLVEEGVLERRR